MHKAMENLILLAESSEKEDFIEFLQNIDEHNEISTLEDLAEVLDEFIM